MRLATKWYARRRDRAARKLEFLAYLKQWESEIDIPYTPGPYAGTVSGQFPINKNEFEALVGTIEDEYSGEKSVQLVALAKAITDMTQGKVNSAEGQNELREAIRAVIAFLKSG